MSGRTMSPAQVRQTGLEALARALGPVGMVRFLQQFEAGAGDYSADRHGWLDASDVATLAVKIQQSRTPEGDAAAP